MKKKQAGAEQGDANTNFEMWCAWNLSLLRAGEHHSASLQAAWDKDGEEAFTFSIVEEVEDPSLLAAAEKRYIDARFAEGKSYNVAEGHDGPMSEADLIKLKERREKA